MMPHDDQTPGPDHSGHKARVELEGLMSAISRTVYGTRWFTNLEYLLWEALEKGDPHPFTAQQLLELRALAEASDCWVRQDDGKTRPVPLEEWRRHYARRRGESGAKAVTMAKADGKTMQARDVMTSEVYTASRDTPLPDVAKLLVERRISAVPVVDAERRVIGIVSEGDLLHRQETATEQRRSWWLKLFADADALAREYVRAHGMKAHHVMTKHVFCVSETTPLGEIADLLDQHKIKRVPVLRDGRLVGIVSRADIVRAFVAVGSEQSSKRPSSSDRRIRAELQRRLEGQSWSSSIYLQSVVHDGIVEFFGQARSEDQRHALRVLAETIPGVKKVEDRTTLDPHLFAI